MFSLLKQKKIIKISLLLLLSLLVCFGAVVGADAASDAPIPFSFDNIHLLFVPASDRLNSNGEYMACDWYTVYAEPNRCVSSSLVYSPGANVIPGSNGVFIGNGISLNNSGKSWKCVSYFDLNLNALPSFVDGQEYIFDLYFAFHLDATDYNALDFDVMTFLYDGSEFKPIEVFNYSDNVNIAHFNFSIWGHQLNNTKTVTITLDRAGSLFRQSYFEIGFLSDFPANISVYSDELKAAEKIINAGSNVPQPDFDTPANQLASTNQTLNNIEGQFQVNQEDINNLNNTFDTIISENDFSGGTQLINNWYSRLFEAVPEVYLLLMFSLLLGLCAFVIGRSGKY